VSCAARSSRLRNTEAGDGGGKQQEQGRSRAADGAHGKGLKERKESNAEERKQGTRERRQTDRQTAPTPENPVSNRAQPEGPFPEVYS
jgi:hypothetical protein